MQQNFELPSNRKFGYLWSLIFIFLSIYNSSLVIRISFATLSVTIFVIALFKPIILQKLNLCWFRLGLILNRIISPIILGTIFFGLLTPLAFILRILGRDELRIHKQKNNSTFWIKRNTECNPTNFKQQF